MLKRLIIRIKHWRTGHNWAFVRNIYGDEINYRDGFRSEYKCTACGAYKYGPMLGRISQL